MDRLQQFFAARIFGPDRPAGPGRPYNYESAEYRATHYVAQYRARRARGIGASAAIADVLRHAPSYRPGGRYSSPWRGPFAGTFGAPFTAGRGAGRYGDIFRWCEDTRAAGLRFIGWADELPGGPNHVGWYSREDEFETLRGGVWQWPGGRIVYGWAEFETGPGGRSQEMNPGSAAICVSDVLRASREEMREMESPADWDTVRDAACWADSVAQHEAESQREYDSAYQAGRRAAERIAETNESRRDALDLLAEMREARKAGERERPAICRALRDRLDSILRAIRDAREERESGWADCPAWLEIAWRDGYADELGHDGWNRFARSLRLSRFAGEPGDGLLSA